MIINTDRSIYDNMNMVLQFPSSFRSQANRKTTTDEGILQSFRRSARNWSFSIILLIMLFPAATPAVMLRGNLFGELYSFQALDSTHIRPFAGMRAGLSIWRAADGRALDLNTFFRWTNSLRTTRPTVPATNVYDLNLHLSGLPSGTDLYLGRQFVYNSAGSVLLDGLRLRYRIGRPITLELFGGSSVDAMTPAKVRSLSSYAAYGGRLSVTASSKTRVGLNWIDKLTNGNESWHRATLDVDHRVELWQVYGRIAYNLSSEQIAELLARLSYSPNKWHLSGEFSWREPSVSSTSLFGMINYRRYQQVRLEARRTLWRDLALYSQFHGTLYSGDDIWRVNVGIAGSQYALVWRHQSGRDGENNALTGTLNVPFASHWELYAGFNAGRYRVQTDQDGHSDAYSTQVGLTWRSASGITATAEGQYQRNALQKSGSQLYFRLAKDFSLGEKSAGARP